MTRVVSSGTTSNGDVVFYDDAEWPLSGGSAFGSSDEIQGAPPPSNAAPMTPPPQASGPGAAIDNNQQSLAMTVFFPLAGIFPSRNGGGDDGGSFLGEIGIFAGNFGPSGSPSPRRRSRGR